MPTPALGLAVLAVGLPAALLAGGLGWVGARPVWLLVNSFWPVLGLALALAATNSDDPALRLDAPVASGALLGGGLSILGAPLWLGGFWVRRRARRAQEQRA
ncbi:MAG: hypothetical protein R3D59_00625 [Paracoccaceae bacterium]